MLVSFDIRYIRRGQRQRGNGKLAEPVQRVSDLISKYTNVVF